jgi:hypothetical protein
MTRRILRILEGDGVVTRFGGDRLELLEPGASRRDGRLSDSAREIALQPMDDGAMASHGE